MVNTLVFCNLTSFEHQINLKIKVMTDHNDTWTIYTDNKGEYRWRRTAANGKIVGASSEGYSSRQACLDNARRNGYKK